jgi:hypothetical protein
MAMKAIFCCIVGVSLAADLAACRFEMSVPEVGRSDRNADAAGDWPVPDAPLDRGRETRGDARHQREWSVDAFVGDRMTSDGPATDVGPPKPVVEWNSSGTCSAGVAIAGGANCSGNDIMKKSVWAWPNGPVWIAQCDGAPQPTVYVGCAPSGTLPYEGTGNPQQCASNDYLLGGGCECNTGHLHSVAPTDTSTWTCSCIPVLPLTPTPICAQQYHAQFISQTYHYVATNTVSQSTLTVLCDRGYVLSGGCEAGTESKITASYPSGALPYPNEWFCGFTVPGASNKAHVLCYDPK